MITQMHAGVMYPYQRGIVNKVWLGEEKVFPSIPLRTKTVKREGRPTESKSEKNLISQTKFCIIENNVRLYQYLC